MNGGSDQSRAEGEVGLVHGDGRFDQDADGRLVVRGLSREQVGVEGEVQGKRTST